MYYLFKTALAFVSLFNSNLSVLIMETPCVYSEVGIEFFNTMEVDIILQLFNTQVLSAKFSSFVAVNVARSRILPFGICSPRWIHWCITVQMWATFCRLFVRCGRMRWFFLRLEKRSPTNTFIFWSVRCCWCAVPFLLIQRYREHSHRTVGSPD
jgi:hypothetical protein